MIVDQRICCDLAVGADCKAVYRLIGRSEVTFEAVTASHYQNTRTLPPGRCLVVSDTTEIDYGYKSERKGPGPLTVLKLDEIFAAATLKGSCQIWVSANKNQKARWAHAEVRSTSVTMLPRVVASPLFCMQTGPHSVSPAVAIVLNRLFQFNTPSNTCPHGSNDCEAAQSFAPLGQAQTGAKAKAQWRCSWTVTAPLGQAQRGPRAFAPGSRSHLEFVRVRKMQPFEPDLDLRNPLLAAIARGLGSDDRIAAVQTDR